MRAEKDLELLKEDGFQYPKGMKAFKRQEEATALDQPFSESGAEDWVFTAKIPKGSTRREALAIVHHKWAGFTKLIDVEQLHSHVWGFGSAFEAVSVFGAINEFEETSDDVDIGVIRLEKAS